MDTLTYSTHRDLTIKCLHSVFFFGLDMIKFNLCCFRDDKKERDGHVFVLMFPSQVQATVVGFLASIAAVIFGWIPEGQFKIGHAVLLCASSVATAFIASLLLGERTNLFPLNPIQTRAHYKKIIIL